MQEDMETSSTANHFVIKATNVPAEFFADRDKAKRYFRRFGRVKLVMFRPRKQCLFIEYTNEDSMLNALEVAGEYKGHVFSVTRDTETVIKKKKPKKEKDPDWASDPEVKSELEAMGAFTPPTRTYELRQEPMSVDSEVSKLKQRNWRAASASPKPLKRKNVKEPISSEHAELLHTIKQQASTVEDRFRILDARDKLIRLKLKKNVEISKAKATVGTCPDMCPEKERVMRETQHQVSLYEQEEGGKGIMNPKLAVKQYSRSSADQEAPLPQDLRPVSVLQMTMGYLMHRIISLCENSDVNIAEWYHFLWDRTRGIRKDITQQELCCQGSVELVEQCARFHIFCSARLVSEDPSVFDQKINTENLTKCLQTLKYMYHDLELKGESCRNEPEFRAYIILLNLNDGNFMWEVQQLRKEIQQSKEVKFALDVYSSLDKHNYVKFFKLVNSTTFLNACILMRYFIQVRIAAIKTLLKSYSPRVSQSSLPVHYLTKVLAFENTESTVEFFESYGLFTDTERTRVVLNKTGFSPPEYPYVLDRAKNLVESKREKSTGEIICGRELPPKIYESHIPQNSFDQNGFLKIPSELIEIEPIKPLVKIDEPVKLFEKKDEQIKLVETKDEPLKIFEKKDQPLKMFEKKEEPSGIFSSPIAVQTTSIFSTKQNEHSINIFGPPKTETMKMIWTSPSTKKISMFSGVTDSSTLSSISSEGITPILPIQKTEETSIEPPKKDENESKRIQDEIRRKKEQEEKKEAERRRKLDEERKEAKKREELRLKILKEEEEKRRLEEIARRKKREEEQILEQERRKNIEITNSVNDLISDLLEDVEENVKEIKLNEIRKTMEIRRAKKVLLKWKEHTRRKRKRKALDFSPLWLGGKTAREEAEELLTKSQVLALQSMKRYKRGKPIEIDLNKGCDISKIDLSELTYKLLTKKIMDVEMKLQNELFWKVTISLPNESEYNCGLNHIEQILDRYIKWEKRGNTTMVIEQSKLIPTVTYCLQKQKGLVINNKNDTNGFIFLANNINDNLSTRIVQNLKKFGSYVKVPIVLVLQNYVEGQSNLKDLISNEMISDYLILVDKFTSKNLINLIEDALIFLSTRVEKTPPLEMDTLKSFLQKYLCDDLGKRINSFAKWNCNYKDCLKYPNTVIYLYNEAISRLKSILISETCHEYQKFPEIFKDFLRSQIPDTLPCDYKYFPDFWDNPTYTKHIETLLDSLRLPNLLEDWPPKDQKQLEVGILKYCSKVSKEPRKCFYKFMGILLKGINPITNFGDVSNVVWTDIVELLITEKLQKTDFSLYGTGFVSKSVFNQLVVVYDISMLNDYIDSDWFYVNNPIIKLKIQEVLNKQKERIEMKPEHIDIEDIDLDKIIENLRKPRNFDVSKLKNEISECRKAVKDLEETTAIQKRMFETSGKILRSLLDDD